MAVAEIVRSYLEIFLSWPVVTLVLGLLALWSFRAPLADFLRRMGRVEGYGVRIEAMDPLQQRQEAKKAILPENQDALQQYITENPQQVIELYQRTFNSYWFERAFNLIFGSQLELMEHLEAKTEKGERYINLVRFFQEFTRRGGPSTTQLADYLRFLKDIRFLEYLEREGEQYARITSSGVDFLSYLRAQYPAGYKFKPW